MTLPEGKYKIRRFVPTYTAGWKDMPGGGFREPKIVPGHWTEITIKSTKPIIIAKL